MISIERNPKIKILNQAATTITASTYFTGAGEVLDQANDIKLDSSGNIYVAGWVGALTFPGGGLTDTFVRGFAAVFSPDLTTLIDSYNAVQRTAAWGTVREENAPGTAAAAEFGSEETWLRAGRLF